MVTMTKVDIQELVGPTDTPGTVQYPVVTHVLHHIEADAKSGRLVKRWRVSVHLRPVTEPTIEPWTYVPVYTVDEYLPEMTYESLKWIIREAYDTHDKALASLEEKAAAALAYS